VKSGKEEQMRRLEKLKEMELLAWKKKNVGELERKFENCLKNVGEAHRAAKEEEIERGIFQQKREEFDLMAAQRGRFATHKELEARRKEEEERVMKRKRMRQKTVGIQADFFEKPTLEKTRIDDFEDSSENYSLCEEHPVGSFKAPHKYNPTNFAPSSSTDSSILPSVQTDSEESQQFDQITKLLKRKQSWKFSDSEQQEEEEIPVQEILEISDESDSENIAPQPSTKTAKHTPRKPPKRVVVKSPGIAGRKKTIKLKSQGQVPQKLNNLEKFSKNYDNLVMFNRKRDGQLSAMDEAQKTGRQTDPYSSRPKEAMEKEKTRRDYEKLREELDLLAKEEQKARIDAKVRHFDLATI
jgi:hypothetical protein